MPATVWIQAIAVTPAATLAPATSNSKEDSTHNSTNASTSRNKRDNRTTNTVWMLTKTGILLKSGMAAAAGIMDVISSRTARIDSRKDNNIHKGHLQQ